MAGGTNHRMEDLPQRTLQPVLMAGDVAHEGRVVARHLRGGLHIARLGIEVEVLASEPAEIAQER